MSSRRKFLQQIGTASALLPLASIASFPEDEIEERIISYEKKFRQW